MEKKISRIFSKRARQKFHFTFSSIPRQVTLRLCKPFSCIVSKTLNFFSLPVTAIYIWRSKIINLKVLIKILGVKKYIKYLKDFFAFCVNINIFQNIIFFSCKKFELKYYLKKFLLNIFSESGFSCKFSYWK